MISNVRAQLSNSWDKSERMQPISNESENWDQMCGKKLLIFHWVLATWETENVRSSFTKYEKWKLLFII